MMGNNSPNTSDEHIREATALVRKLNDEAKDINEMIDIAKKYNIHVLTQAIQMILEYHSNKTIVPTSQTNQLEVQRTNLILDALSIVRESTPSSLLNSSKDQSPAVVIKGKRKREEPGKENDVRTSSSEIKTETDSNKRITKRKRAAEIFAKPLSERDIDEIRTARSFVRPYAKTQGLDTLISGYTDTIIKKILGPMSDLTEEELNKIENLAKKFLQQEFEDLLSEDNIKHYFDELKQNNSEWLQLLAIVDTPFIMRSKTENSNIIKFIHMLLNSEKSIIKSLIGRSPSPEMLDLIASVSAYSTLVNMQYIADLTKNRALFTTYQLGVLTNYKQLKRIADILEEEGFTNESPILKRVMGALKILAVQKIQELTEKTPAHEIVIILKEAIRKHQEDMIEKPLIQTLKDAIVKLKSLAKSISLPTNKLTVLKTYIEQLQNSRKIMEKSRNKSDLPNKMKIFRNEIKNLKVSIDYASKQLNELRQAIIQHSGESELKNTLIDIVNDVEAEINLLQQNMTLYDIECQTLKMMAGDWAQFVEGASRFAKGNLVGMEVPTITILGFKDKQITLHADITTLKRIIEVKHYAAKSSLAAVYDSENTSNEFWTLTEILNYAVFCFDKKKPLQVVLTNNVYNENLCKELITLSCLFPYGLLIKMPASVAQQFSQTDLAKQFTTVKKNEDYCTFKCLPAKLSNELQKNLEKKLNHWNELLYTPSAEQMLKSSEKLSYPVFAAGILGRVNSNVLDILKAQQHLVIFYIEAGLANSNDKALTPKPKQATLVTHSDIGPSTSNASIITQTDIESQTAHKATTTQKSQPIADSNVVQSPQAALLVGNSSETTKSSTTHLQDTQSTGVQISSSRSTTSQATPRGTFFPPAKNNTSPTSAAEKKEQSGTPSSPAGPRKN